MRSILSQIQSPQDIKSLSSSELDSLAFDIRKHIIETLSVTGGHLSSNLGCIELTIALHKVFDSPTDPFIFDTSHQTYTHKLLTGRKEQFSSIRKYKGLSGFSSPDESQHDIFFAGHAATALSLGLGLAKSRDLEEKNNFIVPVVGDAAFTCGLTFEALNNMSKNIKNFVLILNDNAMAIAKNVGAITNILNHFFHTPSHQKIQKEVQEILSQNSALYEALSDKERQSLDSIKSISCSKNFFEQFGLTYQGPVDGHNISELTYALELAKTKSGPVVLHALTNKGHGMDSALENPMTYHGVKPFNPISGKFIPSTPSKLTFSKIFGNYISELSDSDSSIVTLSPATPYGSNLTSLMEKHPDRCIDVGIAEGHCITFAGGLAASKKLKVVVCIYATFLQRALDNLFHDVCLQKQTVLFAIDRGGLAGGDGATHNGIYDISFLNAIPNLIICQPRNGDVLKDLVNSAFSWGKSVAMRYPNLPTTLSENPPMQRVCGKGEIVSKGSEIAILALGHKISTALEVKESLSEHGLDATIIDPVFIKPLDHELIQEVFSSHTLVITIEEHALSSGFGSILNNFAVQHALTKEARILNFGIADNFVHHGDHASLTKEVGLDAETITKKILSHMALKEEMLPAEVT